MLRNLLFLSALISTLAFGQEEREIMYRIYDSEEREECGYVNKMGDTLIPFGICLTCFSDSLNYAIIIRYIESRIGPGFLAINSQGKQIFRVFPFENGPDYIEDGTMRIIEDGKIGYATEDGEIIIQPNYEAARPFENGKAQVSFHATKQQDGEHWRWIDTDWFYIDKNGNQIEE